MLGLKFYEEALEFAQTALDISVSQGMETAQDQFSPPSSPSPKHTTCQKSAVGLDLEAVI